MLNTYLFIGICLTLWLYSKESYGKLEGRYDYVYLAVSMVVTVFGWLPLIVYLYVKSQEFFSLLEE